MICHEPHIHVEHVLQVADGVEQCIALLFTTVLLLAYQAILGYRLPKTLSPGVTSGILVTSWSLAALITQATATALLSCRNASCGFMIAQPAD